MNFHDPVRVATEVAPGTATATVAFASWKGVPVASTTHTVAVLPAKAGPKLEPIAPNLIASLPHPDRKAGVYSAAFSPDGARLLTAGYPSGIVQIWDVARKQEIRRILTPPANRSADYVELTPDWKTLYVTAQKRVVKPFQRDGKRLYRFDFTGSVCVWDVATGAEKEPLMPPAGSAPRYGKLTPDGRLLVCVEERSYEAADQQPNAVTVVWDLAAGKRRQLCDSAAFPAFASDSKTVAVISGRAGTSVVKLLDLANGKAQAAVNLAEKERSFALGPFSPDGATVAVYVGGKKGAPTEVWFLDGRTLADRGKLIGEGDPKDYGWSSGLFTPDARRFIAVDGVGNILVWNVAGHRLERTIRYGDAWTATLRVSPDSKTVAVAWLPRWDRQALGNDPDPQDLPQPRVTLIDLGGNAPPRVLIAPHGYIASLAYSPDGTLLACGAAGATHLFDVRK